ncbi:MAG: FHA domain-containing protein [Phormidesmis sp. CAN_BIN44]|nr:FHA domain-containing protein [Phormidesmis sp. CAN_BIN44]
MHPAFLVLQEPVEGTEIKQTRYTLSLKEALIGRKSECDIHIPDHYTCVSGRHLEVHGCSTNDRGSSYQWQVQNCAECRNGTYINDEPLVGSRILKSGDRLVLGDKLLSSKSPQLIFECSSISDAILTEVDNDQSYRRLVNCDILFIVVDSERENLEAEEELLDLAKANSALEVFLITFAHDSIEAFCVGQQANSPISLEDLNQHLTSMSEKQSSLIKHQRVLSQATLIFTEVHQFLLTNIEKLKEEIEKIEAQQSQGNRKGVIEDASSLLRAINEQKMVSLKAIESSLNQSKQDLLDDSLSDSVLQQYSGHLLRQRLKHSFHRWYLLK